jgi:4-hydroxybenzoate polyprenyltransferase/phosphoserine phosphatase
MPRSAKLELVDAGATAGLPLHSEAGAVPLVVDLDGTLVRGDLLIETFAAETARSPRSALYALRGLAKGKAALKARLAERAPFAADSLPYDPQVLELIERAVAAGRPVYLASASNERLVNAVAEHLGVFEGWLGSTDGCNLSAGAKAERLVEMFGSGGFDYVGNEAADLPVWAQARRCISVGAPGGVRRRLSRVSPDARHLEGAKPDWRTWLRLVRHHQWAKNVLVLVTVLTDRAFTAPELLAAAGAFVAFCLAASSIYIVNDLVDLESDRGHPTKKHRPLACGQVPILPALILSGAMLAGALALGAAISLPFLGVLLVYLALTTGYSFVLKRKMLIDAVALAGLYTIRVIAGAVAMTVMVSHWLLLFSFFIFMSLALIKRFTELAVRADAGLPDPTNRNYRASDMVVVTALAAATGYSALVIFGLYLSSPEVEAAYNQPALLWLVLPLLVYWLGRMLIMAHRRTLHDDPVVFAMTDRNSRWVIALTAAIVLAAAI